MYDTGSMMITLTPFPQSIAFTVEETVRILYQFKNGQVTEQELQEAKTPFLGKIHSFQKTLVKKTLCPLHN